MALGKMPRLSTRALTRLAWLIWLASLSIALLAGLLLYFNRSLSYYQVTDAGLYASLFIMLGYGSVGLVIATHRPRHAMGWLFLALALLVAAESFAQQYAIYGLVGRGAAPLPGARLMGWLQRWMENLWFPVLVAVPYLVYPDGQLPSRRWRPLVWLALLAAALLVLGELISPGLVPVYTADPAIMLPMRNPTGVNGLDGLKTILMIGWPLALIVVLASFVAPIIRYRRSRGLERQQLKWFAYFAIVTLLLFPPAFIFGDPFGTILFVVMLIVLPMAAAIAIVRHRLYDIDIIIKRTLVYGALTVMLILIYSASVVLLQALFTAVSGQRSAVAIVISTLLIAALFNPLRLRVQSLIDRRFFRRKYNAERTLSAFAKTARDEVDLERLTAEMLQVVHETIQPEHISLWLRPLGQENES